MTVEELITKLQMLPKGTEVYVANPESFQPLARVLAYDNWVALVPELTKDPS